MKNRIKITLTVCFALLSINLMAQTPTNATVYDCSNVSKNIYSTLSTGKSLVVLSKGFDCSICVSAAPAWQTFAAQNSANVEVWGAMTFTYGMAVPNCNNVNTWRSAHSWNDVFMFIDTTERWYQSGTPRYIVYSAVDSSIVYEGRNATTARNIALNNSTVASLNTYNLDKFTIASSSRRIDLSNLPEDLKEVELIDLTGRTIQRFSSVSNQLTIHTNNITGIALLKFTSQNQQVGTRKIFIKE